MEPLLGSAELERLARADALLAFDFDGTLAPIVDDPADGAFAAGPSVVGVRVGSSGTSAARYYLRGQEEIDELLERLVELRARKAIPPERRQRGS